MVLKDALFERCIEWKWNRGRCGAILLSANLVGNSGVRRAFLDVLGQQNTAAATWTGQLSGLPWGGLLASLDAEAAVPT